jgi:hypothetical protein
MNTPGGKAMVLTHTVEVALARVCRGGGDVADMMRAARKQADAIALLAIGFAGISVACLRGGFN